MAKGRRVSKAAQKRMAKTAERKAEEFKKRLALREAERLKKRLQKKLTASDTLLDNVVLRRIRCATHYTITNLELVYAGNAVIKDDVVVINTMLEVDKKKVEKALRVDFALRTMNNREFAA